MGWLPLLIAVVGFIVIFKMAQKAKPVAVAPLNDGPIEAIEFFWRPG